MCFLDAEAVERASPQLSPSCFVQLLSIRSSSVFCGFLNEVCLGEAWISVKPLCWHQREKKKRKREGGRGSRKTKRQSGLKEQPGFGGRVQAQRCYKDEGGWMRVTEKWGGGGGGGVLVKSLLWCSFVLCATQLLSSPYGNTHTLRQSCHTQMAGEKRERYRYQDQGDNRNLPSRTHKHEK